MSPRGPANTLKLSRSGLTSSSKWDEEFSIVNVSHDEGESSKALVGGVFVTIAAESTKSFLLTYLRMKTTTISFT